MSDDDIRALERQWRATGLEGDEQRYLNALARAGLSPPTEEPQLTHDGRMVIGFTSDRFFDLANRLLQDLGAPPITTEIQTYRWTARHQEHVKEQRARTGCSQTLLHTADMADPIFESRDHEASATVEWLRPPSSLRFYGWNFCAYEINGPAGWASWILRSWTAVLSQAIAEEELQPEYSGLFLDRDDWQAEARALPLLAPPTTDPVIAKCGWLLHPRTNGPGWFGVSVSSFALGQEGRPPRVDVIGPLPANPVGLALRLIRPSHERPVALTLNDLFQLLTGAELPDDQWAVWSRETKDKLLARFLQVDAGGPAVDLTFKVHDGIRGPIAELDLLLVGSKQDVEARRAALLASLQALDEDWGQR